MIRINAPRLLRSAAALAIGTAVAASASAAELARVAANDNWQMSRAEDELLNRRPHILVWPAYGPALKLPIVVLEGTNYTASMTRVDSPRCAAMSASFPTARNRPSLIANAEAVG